VIVVYVFLKEDLVGFSVASGEIPDSGAEGLYSQGYVKTLLYYTDSLEKYHSGTQLIDRALTAPYNHFMYELDLKFIPRSSNINYRINPYGYNEAAAGFTNNFVLADFSLGNGGKYIQSISVAIETLGPAPVIPDSSDYDGALEFMGAYFSWIVNEIVYIFKFAGVFLRGIF